MRYTDLNDLRLRANRIGVVLNAASDYGRKPLPKQYADVWFNAKLTTAQLADMASRAEQNRRHQRMAILEALA